MTLHSLTTFSPQLKIDHVIIVIKVTVKKSLFLRCSSRHKCDKSYSKKIVLGLSNKLGNQSKDTIVVHSCIIQVWLEDLLWCKRGPTWYYSGTFNSNHH